MMPFQSIRDVDELAISDPDAFDRLRRGFHLWLGNQDAEPTDLRASSIRATRHLDVRRYDLGLSNVTYHMKPVRAGELVVIGAREGQGKTAFGEMVALSNSLQHKVLFVTLEMTREEIRDRMLCKLMRTGLDDLFRERSHDTPDYCEAYRSLGARELLIWRPAQRAERTVESIMQRAIDVSASLLVIDHSREITNWEPGRQASAIMDSLGDFVRRTSISTVLVSQLNRDAATHRPHNGNLQDTGKLEQKADRVILLFRPFLGKPGKDRAAEVIVSKNRVGPCFRAHAHWDGPTMAYHDMTNEEESAMDCCQGRGVK